MIAYLHLQGRSWKNSENQAAAFRCLPSPAVKSIVNILQLWLVEPLIMDSLNKGHNRRKPLYKGHTLSIIIVHFNLRREDNLSIKDTL